MRLVHEKTGVVFILIAAVLILVLLSIIGLNARYLTDDYCTAGMLKKVGFWESQSYWYNSWSGRYAFTFSVSLIELSGPAIVSVLPTLLLISWILGTLFLANRVFGKWHISGFIKLFIVVLYVLTVLLTVPNLKVDLYWQTGSVTYLLPVITGSILFGLLSRKTVSETRWKTVFQNCFTLIFSFFCAGFSEVAGILQFVLVILLLVNQYIFNKDQFVLRKTANYLFALLGTVLGLLLIIVSPGSVLRQETFLPHPGIFELMINTIQFSVVDTVKWFVQEAYIIFPVMILSGFSGWFCGNSNKPLANTRFGAKTLFLFISIIVLILASYVPTTWSIKMEPPDRVLILQVNLLSAFVIFLSWLIGKQIRSQIQINNPEFKLVEIGFIVMCIYFSANLILFEGRILRQSISSAAAFSEKWDEREMMINEMLSGDEKPETLSIPMISENFLDVEHIQSDPDNWINRCAAWYYDVDKVIAE